MDTIIPQDVNPPQKQCSKCEKFLPATADYFHRSKKMKDGLQYKCKECIKAYGQEHKEEKSLYSKKYRQENAEREREYKKQYRQRRKEERKQYNDQYYQDHKEERKQYYQGYKERRKQYRQEHREEIRERENLYEKGRKEQKRQYRQTEYGRMLSRMYNHNRRTRKKEASGTYTIDQISDQLKRQRYKCYYAACGHSKFKKSKGKYLFEIDHIVPLTREHTSNSIDNLVLACTSCNRKKHNKLLHEWSEGGRLL